MRLGFGMGIGVALLSCSRFLESPDATYDEPEARAPAPDGFQQYLKASSPQAQAFFGVSLAFQGTTLAVAESFATAGNPNAGAAYVFERLDGRWRPTPIQIPDKRADDGRVPLNLVPMGDLLRLLSIQHWPGIHVALDDQLVAVSVAGHDLESSVSSLTVDGGASVGAAGVVKKDAGWVCVYDRSRLESPRECVSAQDDAHEEDLFGLSLTFSPSSVPVKRLVVGAPRAWSNMLTKGSAAPPPPLTRRGGAAYVFVERDGHFQFEQKVVAPDPVDQDFFGAAVALENDLLVVGAPAEDSAAVDVSDKDEPDTRSLQNGAAYVYRLLEGEWRFEAYVKPKVRNSDNPELFGISLSVADGIVAIGAPGGQSCRAAGNLSPAPGAVYLAEKRDGQWSEECLPVPYDRVGGGFGFDLSLSGDYLSVGAPTDGNPIGGEVSKPLSGTTYLFRRAAFDADASGPDASGADASGVDASGADAAGAGAAAGWKLARIVKAPNADGEDLFGTSVAMGDGLVAIGAPREAGSQSGADASMKDNGTARAGAVYLFSTDL
jgi:hypothetical protein